MSKLLKERWQRLAFGKSEPSVIIESDLGSIEVYDADDWVTVATEQEALEWCADQLTSAYYGRPTVRPEGMPTRFAYVDRYSFEIGSSGPLMVYCETKEQCENQWHAAIDDI